MQLVHAPLLLVMICNLDRASFSSLVQLVGSILVHHVLELIHEGQHCAVLQALTCVGALRKLF